MAWLPRWRRTRGPDDPSARRLRAELDALAKHRDQPRHWPRRVYLPMLAGAHLLTRFDGDEGPSAMPRARLLHPQEIAAMWPERGWRQDALAYFYARFADPSCAGPMLPAGPRPRSRPTESLT